MSQSTHERPGSRVTRKARLRAMFFLVLALIAGAGAILLVQVYIDQLREQAGERTVAQADEVGMVVVSVQDLSVGTVLAPEHLQLLPWPKAYISPESFDAPDELLGEPVIREIVAGQPILRRQMADPGFGEGLSAILARNGTRAMTVSVDRVIGVSGFLQPGDFVDVIATMSPDPETEKALDTEPGRFSKIVLQNVRVLAIGEHLQTDGRRSREVRAVTLEVLPSESERLALAVDYGNIHLTLRSPVDQTLVVTSGITPLGLLLTEGTALDDLFAKTREELAAREAARAPPPRQRPTQPMPQPQRDEEPVIEMLRGSREVESRKLRR
ncbi:MAG: Flp pilus assembly protein CpaB [Phycisphaerales bacterium]